MPHNDIYMIYSAEKHRYLLTLAYANDMRNINLLAFGDGEMNINNAADQVLDKVSRIVYNHIYRHVWHKYRTERALALESENRQILMDAMGDQLEWMVTNGDTYLNAERELPGICPLAHETLAAAGLLFPGNNSMERLDIKPDYAKEGY